MIFRFLLSHAHKGDSAECWSIHTVGPQLGPDSPPFSHYPQRLYVTMPFLTRKGLFRIILNDFPLAMNCWACDTFIRKMDVLNEDRHPCIWLHRH
jgi:hypothetical protein